MVKKISGKEFDEVLSSEKAVVDFSATWCGPCQMLGPVMEEISNEMPATGFYNVDVDENQELAVKYGITNIPAVLILSKGKETARQVGFLPKQQMLDFLDR